MKTLIPSYAGENRVSYSGAIPLKAPVYWGFPLYQRQMECVPSVFVYSFVRKAAALQGCLDDLESGRASRFVPAFTYYPVEQFFRNLIFAHNGKLNDAVCC